MELQKIFDELHDVHVCNSAYEFSTRFLGKSKSYYSVLKAKELEPSIDALSILEIALKDKALSYANDKYEIFAVRRKQLLSLSDKVNALRQQQCIDKLKMVEAGF